MLYLCLEVFCPAMMGQAMTPSGEIGQLHINEPLWFSFRAFIPEAFPVMGVMLNIGLFCPLQLQKISDKN